MPRPRLDRHVLNIDDLETLCAAALAPVRKRHGIYYTPRAAAERIGGENGPFAEVDLQLGSTHKTVVDNAFSDDALEWLMNPLPPSEEPPPFPPSEMYTPAAMVFGTNE